MYYELLLVCFPDYVTVLTSTKTVSYTHLDVYKRQDFNLIQRVQPGDEAIYVDILNAFSVNTASDIIK